MPQGCLWPCTWRSGIDAYIHTYIHICSMAACGYVCGVHAYMVMYVVFMHIQRFTDTCDILEKFTCVLLVLKRDEILVLAYQVRIYVCVCVCMCSYVLPVFWNDAKFSYQPITYACMNEFMCVCMYAWFLVAVFVCCAPQKKKTEKFAPRLLLFFRHTNSASLIDVLFDTWFRQIEFQVEDVLHAMHGRAYVACLMKTADSLQCLVKIKIIYGRIKAHTCVWIKRPLSWNDSVRILSFPLRSK